jgi:hypothetical protein
VRDQGEIVLHGNGGDLEIVRADAAAGAFESTPGFGTSPRAFVVERQRGERTQEYVEFRRGRGCGGGSWGDIKA